MNTPTSTGTPARRISEIDRYRQRVLAEAEKELRQKTRQAGGDLLPIYRRYRKLEEHRLRLWHNAGGGGREISRQRSDLIDILFRDLLDRMLEQADARQAWEGMAVVAFGGYGRREMNPFSDVDIMFLHEGKSISPAAEEVIRRTVTMLWDLGFKVGQSTRSIAQCLKLANEDMLTKTSMIESRYLAGNRDVFHELKKKFESSCVKGHEQEYIAWRIKNQDELRAKYGASVFMQEPHIKCGRGGLRDYQHLLWLAFFRYRTLSKTKLVELKILREPERRALEAAYDFLLRVRTEMHYQNGRAGDVLTLMLQGKIANRFRYPQKNIIARSEEFMRDYYQHTRNIARIADLAIERMKLVREKPAGLLAFLGKTRTRVEKFDGFYARNGRLYAESAEIFQEDPVRLMRLFQHAQTRKLELSVELREMIGKKLRLVDRTFQYAIAPREVFLAILSRKGEVGRILRMMHETGFLGRYLPEFGALTCLVQHEFYHRYTADEHTLVCIEKLDGVLFTEEKRLASYRPLFQKLEDPSVLYLALLLHDTGKAANRRHHEEQSAMLAQKVARRLQLNPARRRSLITLVDAHTELSRTAQTRNLDDPATVETFAEIVKTRANLDALMLLTLADGMGTSDDNWSDWKEALVWQLYRSTSSYLEDGSAYLENFRRDRNAVHDHVRRLLPEDFAEEIDANFEHMPERYFYAFTPEQIAGHVRLFREFFEQRLKLEADPLAPAIRWIHRPEQGHSEVWFVAWDRPALLARIAGAFLSAELNILSADVFTRGDSLALDIFRVHTAKFRPVENRRDQERVAKVLSESLHHAEHFDFHTLITGKPRSALRGYRLSQEFELPTKIRIDNDSHPFCTLVEVQTPDRLGLLYDLLNALGACGVNIETSRITTEMDVAMDTFYVTGKEGGKIVADQAIERLQKQLRAAAVRS